MAWPDDTLPATRMEAHFGDRVVRCFTDRPGSLIAMLTDAVDRNPDGDAVVCGDRRLSYRQLGEEVDRLAAGLVERGIRPGDRVALLLGNRVEFVTSLYAVARLGAIAVPLSVREQKPGLDYVLDDCGASLVIHEADLTDRLPDIAGLMRVAVPFEGMHSPAPPPPVPTVREEDTAVILYTSGTTGKPKGAMLTHLGICHSALHYETCMGLTARDRSVLAVPGSHVTGLIGMVAAMLRVAGALLILPAFKARDFLALASAERMTHTILVPAMYNLCLLQPDFAEFDLSAWRIGAFGGAPMPDATIAALARTVPGLTLMNAYGATETTSPATIMPIGHTPGRLDSVGRAVPCAEIRVMDAEGREVPAGETGELWIRGPMVVKGYWNKPEATAQGFTAGFWHSGDIGSVDADGYVRVFDRLKDMINRGGYKIFSAEVENVLSHFPGVREVAVVGYPCPVLGERVHAFVAAEAAIDTAALKAFCAERLSDYKVPEGFTIEPGTLPRNPNGKVIKRTLRERLANGVDCRSA